jgi:tRNA nucleotidyltransferase (CCA-adding enzyme)
MQIYLVGGAVRDTLLKYPFKDKDWVVVGATIEQMLELGYQQVGKDFPVFLHPKTKDEHALARTERKTAPGYKGFNVHATPDITLEEDLQRRDLTINAIAEDSDGNIVDPYNGKADIENKLLRHVSDAFSEDPVRILRVARFAARYAHLGFSVATETMQLMKTMVKNNEADALVAERVWQEMHKALNEKNPEEFIKVLKECGALKRILPELDILFGIPQPEQYHPEIDTGVHTLMVLQQACLLSNEATVRLAALFHDLGKGATPEGKWPSHHGHEQLGIDIIKAVCKRLKIPNDFKDLAVITSNYHLHVHKVFELKNKTLLKTLERLDAFRKPKRFEQFLIACEADIRGRKNFEDRDYPQAEYMQRALKIAKDIDIQPLKDMDLKGQDMAEAIRKARVTAISKLEKPVFSTT